MQIDVLVAEIGSTTTLVNAFCLGRAPRFVGQGQSTTTVLEGDVRIGLSNAVSDLEARLGEPVSYGEMLAASSAAGGLKMTVHGLIYDMTVKAAREAALGAGGIIRLATAGKLRPSDIERIRAAAPNLILLAGGTDYGERDTALWNAEQIASVGLDSPVIYAGNIENRQEVMQIFAERGGRVYLAENVYPKLDMLNIESTRSIIHSVFEEHIVRAPGMENVRDMVTGAIMPTPGAVMECARLLQNEIGDLLVIDIGGATTDIHSVTEGSDEIATMLVSPEPVAKRTVEGDLGVYVNAPQVLEQYGVERAAHELGFDANEMMVGWPAVPQTPGQLALARLLAGYAANTALERHTGRFRHVYTPQGRKTLAEGKDLTQIKWIVATGGALTRLPSRKLIMDALAAANKSGALLFPAPGTTGVLYDEHYIMASLGVLSKVYPQAALELARASLGI